jgi:hypothetical protein
MLKVILITWSNLEAHIPICVIELHVKLLEEGTTDDHVFWVFRDVLRLVFVTLYHKDALHAVFLFALFEKLYYRNVVADIVF